MLFLTIFLVFVNGKIDPLLKSRGSAFFSPPYDARVDLLVLTEGKLPPGFRGRRISEKLPLFHLRLPQNEIYELSLYPEVKYIHLSRFLKPQLDVSAEETGFVKLEQEGDFVKSGRGVVIGIVDTGLDLYHPDFLHPDGSTKVSFIWDQTSEGNPPEGFDYGYECTAYEINRRTCPFSGDSSSHGTHVSGIIISTHERYRGLAGDCVFVFVKTDYSEVKVLDGVRYIFGIAERFGLPAVVNLSMGAHLGPHDGTSILEETIASLTGSGKIIVAASGNDGGKEIHIGYTLSITSGVLLSVPSFFGLGGSAILEIWYEKGKNLDFLVGLLDMESGVILSSTPWIRPGEEFRGALKSNGNLHGKVLLDATVTEYPLSGKRYVFIEITDSRGTYPFAILQRPRSYPGSISLDGWLTSVMAHFENTEGERVVFMDNESVNIHLYKGDALRTVMVPATARNVISAGSYVSRISWEYGDGEIHNENLTVGERSIFSGIGPSLNPEAGIKPLIMAPGQWVISTLPRNASVTSYMITPDGLHYALDGTSISAPHVTAGVALLLQKNPFLEPRQIEGIICESARRDGFTGKDINELWGCGKFDVSSAVKMVGEERVQDDPPEFLYAKREGDGVILASRGLSRIEVLSESGKFTDMSYSELHHIRDGGRIQKEAQVVLESPRGATTAVTLSLSEGGCGCAHKESTGFPLWVAIFLFLLRTVRGRKDA